MEERLTKPSGRHYTLKENLCKVSRSGVYRRCKVCSKIILDNAILALMKMLSRASFTSSDIIVVILNGGIAIIHLLRLACMHNLGDDGLLDTLNLLALPQLILVIFSKFNVRSVMRAGESVAEACAVSARGAGCSGSRAVVVSAAVIVVASSDDLAD
jgi:hypothetical protein